MKAQRLVVLLIAAIIGITPISASSQLKQWDGDAINAMVKRYLNAQIAAGDGPCAGVFKDAAAGLRRTGDTDGVYEDPTLRDKHGINGWNGRSADGSSIIVYDPASDVGWETTLLHESLHAVRAIEDHEASQHWDDEADWLYPDGITEYYAVLCVDRLRDN